MAHPSHSSSHTHILLEVLERGEDRDYWRSQLRKALDMSDHDTLCRHFASMYGGMGSFSDILFSSANGDQGPQNAISQMNDQFDHHSGKLYHLVAAYKPRM